MSVRERLYPTAGQAVALTHHCADARYVWNLGLEQRNMWSGYDQSRKPKFNVATQMRELAQARKTTWLGEGSSVVQQGALRDLDQAFTNWWKGSHQHPTWRKAGLHEAFKIRDLSVRRVTRRWGEVLVPKVGWVRFRVSGAFDQIVASTSARVSLKAGRWHVAFVCVPTAFVKAATGAIVGIDRGVKNSYATSDGAFGHTPTLTRGEQNRFLVLQRRMARQQRDSVRRARTKAQLAGVNDRLVRRRKDWVEQTSTALVRDHDVIALEALNTRGMVRRAAPKPDAENPGQYLSNGARAKSGLNRAILAQSWGALQKRIQDKAKLATTPTLAVLVDPKFTSQQCRSCGYVAAENRESQAEFCCQSCGHEAHADVNAAENILDRAMNMIALEAEGYTAGQTVNGRVSPTFVGDVNQPAHI